jgi:hypothetical protein
MKPVAERPYMPGYGTLGADEGSGLIPWQWAEAQLREAKNYWVTTLGHDGAPHMTPVWGGWDGECVWFSCGVHSLKARNLGKDRRCTISTEDALNPVVIEGRAQLVIDVEMIATLLAAMNSKYETNYGADFSDPSVNSFFRVRPHWAFALKHEDFPGSPTRWTFET